MTKQTEVRRFDLDQKQPWVVDILAENEVICGYVQPDGTAGLCYKYNDKAEAITAEALYLEKNLDGHNRIKTSAEEEKIKDSNPKYDAGIKKAPLHCIPCGPLFELGLAMFEGSRKYGRHNYRAIGVRASVYYDAAMGHIVDWWEGEDIDPDSGLHHLIKAIACLFVVRDSMLMGNYNDDRPLKYPGGLKGRARLNKEVEELTKKYPSCEKPFLEKDRE